MDFSSEDVEKNKKLAILQREVAVATKKIIMDEMSHSARWVMASVLAINSGGLIASVNSVNASDWWSISAVLMFYVGVAVALLMGWISMRSTQRMLPHHSKLIAFWELASIEGTIDQDGFQKIYDDFMSASLRAFAHSRLGWFSFFLFSMGLACLAIAGVSGDLSAAELVQRNIK